MPSATTPADVVALFHPRLQPKVEYLLDQNFPLSQTLLDEVAFILPSQSSSYFFEPPDSCYDFLNMCKMIFSQAFVKSLKSRISGFDALVGTNDNNFTSHDPCIPLSDLFIKEDSRSDWLELMIDSINMLCLKFSTNLDDAPAPAAADNIIKQITLRGTNLKTAWMQHPTTSVWQPPTPNFTPQQPATPMIFHGTTPRPLTPAGIDTLCRGQIRL